MDSQQNRPVYESSVPFAEGGIDAAVVYCSDGRFGEQIEDFLHHGLGLIRFDRLVVPGGGGSLAGHFQAHIAEEGVMEQLRFLIDAHGLGRIVLISHEDCGFYTGLLRISSLQLESQQMDDMKKAVSRVRALSSLLRVEAYFVRTRYDGKVQFDAVDV